MNEGFQCCQVQAKQFPSLAGCLVSRTGFPANKLLGDLNNLLLFQRFQMTGQVPVGQSEQFLQRIEIKHFIDHERRHDAKSYAAFKYFLKV